MTMPKEILSAVSAAMAGTMPYEKRVTVAAKRIAVEIAEACQEMRVHPEDRAEVIKRVNEAIDTAEKTLRERGHKEPKRRDDQHLDPKPEQPKADAPQGDKAEAAQDNITSEKGSAKAVALFTRKTEKLAEQLGVRYAMGAFGGEDETGFTLQVENLQANEVGNVIARLISQSQHSATLVFERMIELLAEDGAEHKQD